MSRIIRVPKRILRNILKFTKCVEKAETNEKLLYFYLIKITRILNLIAFIHSVVSQT